MRYGDGADGEVARKQTIKAEDKEACTVPLLPVLMSLSRETPVTEPEGDGAGVGDAVDSGRVRFSCTAPF